MITSSAVKPFSISGNMEVGVCCSCEMYGSGESLVKHTEQNTLYYCQKEGCNCLVCKEHLMSCGYCYGCCAEEHGLGEGH